MRGTLLPALIGLFVGAVSYGANAYTLTFPGANGPFVGPDSDGVFTYDVFSGGLYREAGLGGNPVPHLEGGVAAGGGVLRIIRNDIVGGLFTFDAADVAVFIIDGNNVTVEGFVGGMSQGTDTLVTLNGNDNWVTRSSVTLNGVLLDQLRITLDAPGGWEEVDNVVLTAKTSNVPDAGSTMALFGLALLGVAGFRRAAVRG